MCLCVLCLCWRVAVCRVLMLSQGVVVLLCVVCVGCLFVLCVVVFGCVVLMFKCCLTLVIVLVVGVVVLGRFSFL